MFRAVSSTTYSAKNEKPREPSPRWSGKKMAGDEQMQLNEYQQRSKRTLNSDLITEDQLANYCLGVAGEAGEVADIIKKAIYHGHILSPEKITEELGDVLFYVAAIASTLYINLDDIAEKNIEKLRRRYPDGFSQKASRERAE